MSRPPEIGLALGHDDVFAQPDRAGDTGQGLGPDQRGVPARQRADLLVGEALEQQVRDDQAEDPVAEELEPLEIPLPASLAGRRARVGQRLLEQLRPRESVSERYVELGKTAFDDTHIT